MLRFLPVAFFVIACSQPNRITQRDIQGAEKLLGISFSTEEKNKMSGYLLDNRKGYDSMRKYRLDFGTTPVMQFDPRPDHFAWKVRSRYNHWPDMAATLPEKDEEIAFLSITELGALIRSGQLSSTRLTTIYLERLKKYKDTLQAVVTITEKLALDQARQADAEIKSGKYRGPLHGIPYGIKDLFSVPGYPTTWGAEPYKDQVIEDEANVVTKLREAGAVLVAKLVSGALARGDVWFGGKTKNPWDLKQGASGSSAGSASAVTAGLVAFTIGTETLGSILAPSSRCGASGLRPTYGSVSRDGCMTLSWSMDKAGPICRSALDCAIVFDIIRGRSPEEGDRSVVDYAFNFNPPADLTGYRIGYFKGMFDKDTTRTGSHNAETLELFKSLGAQLQEVPFPGDVPYDVFDVILRAEAGAFFDDLVREHRDRLLSEQGPESRANSLRQSRFIPAVEYFQASRHRRVLINKLHAMIKDYDFIIAPSAGRNLSMATNLSGHPAMSVPNGFDKRGRPTSITLIGNLYDEGPMLEAAYLFQKASEFENRHPDRFR